MCFIKFFFFHSNSAVVPFFFSVAATGEMLARCSKVQSGLMTTRDNALWGKV